MDLPFRAVSSSTHSTRVPTYVFVLGNRQTVACRSTVYDYLLVVGPEKSDDGGDTGTCYECHRTGSRTSVSWDDWPFR